MREISWFPWNGVPFFRETYGTQCRHRTMLRRKRSQDLREETLVLAATLIGRMWHVARVCVSNIRSFPSVFLAPRSPDDPGTLPASLSPSLLHSPPLSLFSPPLSRYPPLSIQIPPLRRIVKLHRLPSPSSMTASP